MNRIAVGVALVAAVVVCSAIAYRTGQSGAASALSASAAARPPAISSAAPPTMRARVREAIERADVRGRDSLDRFLDMLETRARTQGKVTALEIEPGVAMIELHSKDPEELSRFSERMQRLQEELSRASAKPDAGASANPDDLLTRLAGSKHHSEKQALIREYLDAASELPAERQAQALERLNTVAGAKGPAPDAATLDATYQAIETAKDEVARQDFIREYLELVAELPDRERDERLARLNARHGRPETQ